MTERKKGDRVLVERFVLQDEHNGHVDAGCHEGAVPTGTVHDHPGVSVADLVEELNALWNSTDDRSAFCNENREKARRLCDAREAANKPKDDTAKKVAAEVRDYLGRIKGFATQAESWLEQIDGADDD